MTVSTSISPTYSMSNKTSSRTTRPIRIRSKKERMRSKKEANTPALTISTENTPTPKPSTEDIKILKKDFDVLLKNILTMRSFYERLANTSLPSEKNEFKFLLIKIFSAQEIQNISQTITDAPTDTQEDLQDIIDRKDDITHKLQDVFTQFERDQREEQEKRKDLLSECDKNIEYLKENAPAILQYHTEQLNLFSNITSEYCIERIISPKDLSTLARDIQKLKNEEATSPEIHLKLKIINHHVKELKEVIEKSALAMKEKQEKEIYDAIYR